MIDHTPAATRLLLVDDEDGIRRVLGLVLADLGYDVRTAANGEEALREFREWAPAIVLTDVKMPGMDGTELLRRIKAERPETEVIMISGHGDMGLAIESLKHDAADFVTKPINDELLEKALARVQEKLVLKRELRAYTENLERMVGEQSARVVELERRIAVGQVVEGLSSAFRGISANVEGCADIYGELPTFISVVDRHGAITAVNSLFACRIGDLVGVKSHTLYYGATGSPDTSPSGRTFATGRGVQSRETLLAPDGTAIPVAVHTAPIMDQNGHPELVLEIALDTTEMDRLREDLERTRTRYRKLFDLVPASITVQDSGLRIVEANRRFSELFGETAGALCHLACKGLDDPCDNCPVIHTFKDGEPHETEEIVTTEAGESLHVLVRTAPIRDEDGRVVEVMEAATDITQIRKLQDHLTSLGLVMGSVSHAVKGMLTALDGGVYRLERGLKRQEPPLVDEALGVVKETVGRIRRTVLDILSYAKSRRLAWEQLDAATFARALESTVVPKARLAGVSFTADIPEALGSLEADPSALAPALVNILENAVDACAMDQTKPEHLVRFSVRPDDGHLTFTVSDNGVGMSVETRAKLFTLFFSSKGHKGTGLGLFIAGQTVEQHGGTIRVDSEPGRGTTFSIRLPRVLPAAAKRPLEDAG